MEHTQWKIYVLLFKRIEILLNISIKLFCFFCVFSMGDETVAKKKRGHTSRQKWMTGGIPRYSRSQMYERAARYKKKHVSFMQKCSENFYFVLFPKMYILEGEIWNDLFTNILFFSRASLFWNSWGDLGVTSFVIFMYVLFILVALCCNYPFISCTLLLRVFLLKI